MKTSIKICMKICIFLYVLTLTPFFSALPQFLKINEETLTSDIFEHTISNYSLSIKDQLNLMKISDQLIMSTEEDAIINEKDETIPIKQETTTTINKKVYIYNTHQQEQYKEDKTVIDASVLLANTLSEKGIQVVYETNDMNLWLKENSLDYNYSYHASNYYIKKAIEQYGDFDLIIDFHRDALPRESTYINIDNVSYAKLMFVIGGLSKNVEPIASLANTMENLVQSNKAGIVKSSMIREAYFNQDISPKMLLVEVGSENNSFDEVENSTKVLAQAIIQYFQG